MPPLLRRKIHRWPGMLILLLIAVSTVLFFYRHPYAKRIVYDYPLVQQAKPVVEQLLGTGTGTDGTIHDFLSSEAAASGAVASSASSSAMTPLPDAIHIQVPFAAQAPLGDWGLPYQEACEEASLILVHHFLEGEPITPDQMNTEILDLVKTENDKFGYSADITAEELATVADKQYGYDTKLFYTFTVDDIRRLLAAGHPVIVPLAGREVGNPHYRGAGPWYHMLVITGYENGNFVTNDVGTKFGEGYEFPYAKIMNAIHDWNQQNENIDGGRKVMLVVDRKG